MSHWMHRALPALTATLLITGCSQSTEDAAQSGAGMPPPDSPETLAHIENARQLAGTDVVAPFEFFCVAGNARPNSRTAPLLEPVQLFDNLYAVGNSETIVHAITTPEGIILIDSGYLGQVETDVVPGLVALGLDPADVRYVLLGHGHGDHYGGAAYFQERYGARVGTMAADWNLVEEAAASAEEGSPPAPTRDLVIRDGVPIRLGGISVTPISIPGHTQGSLAYIFPVTDGGTPHTAGLFGGTILGAVSRR